MCEAAPPFAVLEGWECSRDTGTHSTHALSRVPHSKPALREVEWACSEQSQRGYPRPKALSFRTKREICCLLLAGRVPHSKPTLSEVEWALFWFEWGSAARKPDRVGQGFSPAKKLIQQIVILSEVDGVHFRESHPWSRRIPVKDPVVFAELCAKVSVQPGREPGAPGNRLSDLM